MSKPSKKQISDSRALLQNPYAYLDGAGGFAATPKVIDVTVAHISADQRLHENKYAHLDGADCLSTKVLVPRCTKNTARALQPHQRKGAGYQWIETAARNLQQDIWRRRHELWPDGVPTDHVELLNPVIALSLIGFDYEMAETLGQYSNESGTFEVAGIIDFPSSRVHISQQLPFNTRSFTTAHELGHAILHEGMRMHRDRPLDGSQQERGLRDRVEFEADKFATFFLMPGNLLRARFRAFFLCDKFVVDEATAFALDPSGSLRLLAKKQTRRDLARILASTASYNGRHFRPLVEQFKVSIEAMAIRLEELTLV